MVPNRAALIAVLAFAALGLTPSMARASDKLACVAAVEAAQTLRSEGKLKAAREKLIVCAQASCPKVVREDCATGLRDVETETPSIVVRANDGTGNDLVDVHLDAGGSRLADRLDGRPITLDPGAITLHVTADGFSPKDVQLVIARGEKARTVVITLERPGKARPDASDAKGPAPASPPAAKSSPAPWILLGVGVASLGAFGALEGIGHAEYDKLTAGCGKTRTCTEDAIAPTRTKFIAAGVTMGVGIAAIGAAATIWIVSSKPKKPSTGAASSRPIAAASPRVGIAVAPSSFALRGTF